MHVIAFDLCLVYSQSSCTQGNRDRVMSVAMVSQPVQLEDAMSIQLSCLLTHSSPEKLDGDTALEDREKKKIIP